MGLFSNGGWFNDFTSTINPFDDENGAFQGSGGTAPAVRGQPRAGQGPDYGNYVLNYDSSPYTGAAGSSADNASVNASNIGQQAYNSSQGLMQGAQMVQGQGQQQGQALGAYGTQQAGNLGRGADMLSAMGGSYGQQGSAAAGRNLGNGAAVNGSMGIAQQLANAGGPTQSGAGAMLQQGQNEAMNSALALSKSGQGFGGNAASTAQAMQQAPGAISTAANNAAMLRAQESQADAGRRLQALSQSGQQYNAAGNQLLQGQQLNDQQQNMLNQMGLGYSQLGQGAAQNAAGLGLQGLQAGGQLGLGYNQLGLGTQLDANQQGLANELAAGGLGLQAGNMYLGAGQLGLQGAQAALQGTMGYEDALNQLYGYDVQSQIGNRGLDIQKGANQMGGALGLLSAVGSVAGMG